VDENKSDRYLLLLRDEEVVVPNVQLEDSFTDCLNQAAIYRYRLEAENSDNFYYVATSDHRSVICMDQNMGIPSPFAF
jgi:hypothetical protein